MDLAALHEIADQRHSVWNAAGVRWAVTDGPLTDKPAAWLTPSTHQFEGQLTVWVSGEAEMDWGTLDRGGFSHYGLDTRESLGACVADLEKALGLA
jgi:hypothetical protein